MENFAVDDYDDLIENGELKYEKPNDNELKNIVDFINKHAIVTGKQIGRAHV